MDLGCNLLTQGKQESLTSGQRPLREVISFQQLLLFPSLRISTWALNLFTRVTRFGCWVQDRRTIRRWSPSSCLASFARRSSMCLGRASGFLFCFVVLFLLFVFRVCVECIPFKSRLPTSGCFPANRGCLKFEGSSLANKRRILLPPPEAGCLSSRLCFLWSPYFDNLECENGKPDWKSSGEGAVPSHTLRL